MSEQRGRLTVLAVIAAAGSPGISRDRLLALFWPDSDHTRARGALNQALFALRRSTNEPDLISGSSELRLNPAVIDSDVAAFDRAIAANDPAAAIEVYRGPFLDGVFSRGQVELEQWIGNERARLARRYMTALEQVANSATGRGDALGAVEAWHSLALSDPLSARFARGYMQALANAGDREAALAHARMFSALIRAEFDADPDPAFLAFTDELRATPPGELQVRAESESKVAVVTPPPDSAAAEPGPDAVAAGVEHRRSSWRLVVFAVALASVVVVALVLLLRERLPSPAATRVTRQTALVLTLGSMPGDSAAARFQQTLIDAVVDGVVATSFVDVIDGRTIESGRAIAASARGDGQTAALNAARRLKARYLVPLGTTRDADVVTASARVIDVGTGTVLRTVQAAHGSLTNAEQVIDETRSRTMGALATLEDSRMASLSGPWTVAPKWDSYRAFITGLDRFVARRYLEAAAQFDSAYRRDTTALTPVIWSVFALGNALEETRKDSVRSWLIAHRSSVPEVERAALDFFEAEGRKDPNAVMPALRHAAAVMPGSEWSYMLAFEAAHRGAWAEADSAFQKLDPQRGWARGWESYWSLAMPVASEQHHLDKYLVRLRAARAELPRAPVLANQEVTVLAKLGREREMNAALDEFLAIDWGDARWGPGNLLVSLVGLAQDSTTRHARADRCAKWYREEALKTGLPFRYTSPRLGGCLYSAGRWQEAAVATSAYVDSVLATVATNNLVDRTNLVVAVGYLGRIAAHRGDRAKAERMFQLVETLPEPQPALYRGEYLLQQAWIATILGDRDRAVRLALRSRMCCSPNRPLARPDDPDLAPYATDAAFLRAFGILDPKHNSSGGEGRAPD